MFDRGRIEEAGLEIVSDSLSDHMRIAKIEVPVHAAIEGFWKMLEPSKTGWGRGAVCGSESGKIGQFVVG